MDLSKTLTIYGRKPVLEALQDNRLSPSRLHLADSNKPGGIVGQIEELAKTRAVDVQVHARQALSRISKNGKQDQGVALDLFCPEFDSLDNFIDAWVHPSNEFKAVLLDGITNPQNVGMIIRSCCAAGINAIFYPKRSVAALGPLVIKGSAGTLFNAPIIQCEDARFTAQSLQACGFDIAALDSHAETSLFDFKPAKPTVYVLGGETDGVDNTIKNAASVSLRIPMANNVESLNVAVTAALVAFYAH
ncbi:MAG TPA: 23S rRNA (guanosine(2251)-2'-O)-methyltransferase RlmB [Halieaceae bacterium]|nr:23S rRNA (guanosine(2251)-2'-O)-methyltransferase RlmB [Halieaceae bacterium]